jgi:hypothetical protein
MRKEKLGHCVRTWQEDFDEIDEEAQYEWKTFGTLTLQGFLRFPQCRRSFDRWAREIRQPIVPSLLNWFAVFEHDRWGYNVRIHVVLGGWETRFQPWWITRWQNLSGGEGTFSDYRPGAFSPYVIRKAQADHFFAIAMDLCGWGLNEIDCDRRSDKKDGFNW